jgi:cytochrome c553
MFSRLNGVAWLAGATVLSMSVSLSARASDAPAADAVPAPAAAAPSAAKTGDPAKGKQLFYTCYGCHGVENYKNAYPDYSVPKLRHQQAAYIISALHEYQNGERPHPTMHAQAASLSDQDIADIAAYLQGDPIKPSDKVVGTTPKQAAACGACHGVNGLGVAAPLDPKPPVLAGQHVDYLEQALTSYHNGRRKNVVMDGMAQLLATEDDIKAVAQYFASQPSPLDTATPESK